MAATDKFLIIHGEQGARGGEELWVENHLPVKKEELSPSTLFSYSLGSRSGPERVKDLSKVTQVSGRTKI